MTIETTTNDVFLSTKGSPYRKNTLGESFFLTIIARISRTTPVKSHIITYSRPSNPLKILKNFRFSPSRSYPCQKTVRPLLSIKLLQPLAKSTAIQNLQTEQKPNIRGRQKYKITNTKKSFLCINFY